MSKMLIAYHSPVRNKFENTLLRAVCCILLLTLFFFFCHFQANWQSCFFLNLTLWYKLLATTYTVTWVLLFFFISNKEMEMGEEGGGLGREQGHAYSSLFNKWCVPHGFAFRTFQLEPVYGIRKEGTNSSYTSGSMNINFLLVVKNCVRDPNIMRWHLQCM